MRDIILISTAFVLEHLVLLWDIKADFRYWKEEKPINHSNQGFKRLMLLTPSIILYSIPLYWEVDSLWLQIAIILLVVGISFLHVCFRYWLLFDGLLSNKKRFNFWSLGSDGPEDGRTDNFLQRLKKWQHIAIKVGGAAIFVTIYILVLTSNIQQ